MPKPLLWGGLEIGASEEDFLRLFPDAARRGEAIATSIQMFDCDFEVLAEFDEQGLSRISVMLARTRVVQEFRDVYLRVIDAICANHGRGQARHVRGDMLRKRWREPWVEIDLVAVDDPEIRTLSIVYRKIAIADALRFL